MYSRFELRRLALAGIFILIFTFGIRFFAPGPQPAPDFDGRSKGVEVIVDIPSGASGSQVGELLFKNGVIASSLAFFRVAVADSRSARIAPGEHRLDSRISAKEALNQLLDPNRIVNLIRIRDGARLTEIQGALIDAGFSEVEIKAGFKSVKVEPPFSAKKLEGLLYPAFYPKTSRDTAASIIQDMADRFQASTKEINWSLGEFTPAQLLTIASLVESEGIPEDFSKVARVVYNRLKVGMPLQFDSTIHYIFDRRGELPLSLKDTKKSSPYNTFMNRGLPPGPIGSPTIAAIEATLNPTDGPWLYFVTVLPKQTKFTADYNEFLKFKAEYKRNFAAGEFE
jgi:UPF0755 protein